jgi:hypothetical protein
MRHAGYCLNVHVWSHYNPCYSPNYTQLIISIIWNPAKKIYKINIYIVLSGIATHKLFLAAYCCGKLIFMNEGMNRMVIPS